MPWILPNVKKQATSEPPCFGGVFELKPPINQRTHTRKKVRWVTWVIWPKIIRAAGGAGAGSARLIGWGRPLIAGVETADKLIRLLIMNSRSTMPHTTPPPGGTTLCLKQTNDSVNLGKNLGHHFPNCENTILTTDEPFPICSTIFIWIFTLSSNMRSPSQFWTPDNHGLDLGPGLKVDRGTLVDLTAKVHEFGKKANLNS